MSEFVSRRSEPPVSGPGGTLAGHAAPGDQLHVISQGPAGGTYVNQGTWAEPGWVLQRDLVKQQRARAEEQRAAELAEWQARKERQAERTRRLQAARLARGQEVNHG